MVLGIWCLSEIDTVPLRGEFTILLQKRESCGRQLEKRAGADHARSYASFYRRWCFPKACFQSIIAHIMLQNGMRHIPLRSNVAMVTVMENRMSNRAMAFCVQEILEVQGIF